MVACIQNASEESAGNFFDGAYPNSNVVSDLSFTCIGDTSNNSELIDEYDRGESREDIRAEKNDNMKNSTENSSSEGSAINHYNEQQRNSTLRSINESLER